MGRMVWATEAINVKAAAWISGAGWLLTWDASIYLIGVPLNVLLAGLTGALLGLAYGEPIPGRLRLVTVALVNAFLAAAFTAILPHFPGLSRLLDAPAAAIALLAGFGARWAVPALIDKIPEWIAEWRSRKGGPP